MYEILHLCVQCLFSIFHWGCQPFLIAVTSCDPIPELLFNIDRIILPTFPYFSDPNVPFLCHSTDRCENQECFVGHILLLLWCVYVQKYRLYLRRLSGVTSQQNGMNMTFGGAETFGNLSSLDGINDLRTLAASGQLSPQTLAALHANMISRVGMPNGMGLPSSLDPSVLAHALQNVPLPRPQMDGALLANQSGMVQSMPGPPVLDVDPHLQPHHLSAMGQLSQLDDMPGLRALQHQLAGACASNSNGIGLNNPLGGSSGNLVASSNNESLMMQLLQQRVQQQQQGGGLSVNMPQPSAVLGSPRLLSTDINLGQAGSLTNMGRGPGSSSLRMPGGASVPHSLGSLFRPTGSGVQALNPVGSSGGSFSGSTTVLSPRSGGVPGCPPATDDMARSQHSMRTSLNPLGQATHGHEQVLSQSSRPTWLGSQGGMISGEHGQSIESGRSRFPSQSQTHASGFAGNVRQQSQPEYTSRGMNFPVRLGLDVRPLFDGSRQSHSEQQPTTDNEQKLPKDERASDHVVITKLVDGGVVSHDQSEDLLNFFFKQVWVLL
jgi:hypothetical protein